MLNIIRLEFHKRLGSHNFNTKAIAEKVLFKIEQSGMLPPLNKWEDYLWEPEND